MYVVGTSELNIIYNYIHLIFYFHFLAVAQFGQAPGRGMNNGNNSNNYCNHVSTWFASLCTRSFPG